MNLDPIPYCPHIKITLELQMAKSKADTAQPTVSKMHMVETAIDTLGIESSPSDIQPWVASQYGTEIDKQMISSYASTIRKKRRGDVGGNGLSLSADGGLGSRDLAMLQELIRKVGASELQNYIKVLSR